MFGPEWPDVTGGWRKLYRDELHDFYASNMNRNAYSVLLGI
jgi:hypothetical protein